MAPRNGLNSDGGDFFSRANAWNQIAVLTTFLRFLNGMWTWGDICYGVGCRILWFQNRPFMTCLVFFVDILDPLCVRYHQSCGIFCYQSRSRQDLWMVQFCNRFPIHVAHKANFFVKRPNREELARWRPYNGWLDFKCMLIWLEEVINK